MLKKIVLLFALLLFLFACRKDTSSLSIDIDSISAWVTGTYYVEHNFLYQYFGGCLYTNSDSQDGYLEISIINDSLKVGEWYFEIDSTHQRHFSESSLTERTGIHVSFNETYDSVFIERHQPNDLYLYGTENYYTTGEKVSSTLNTPSLVLSNSGTIYDLLVNYKESALGIDTQYRKDIPILHSSPMNSALLTIDLEGNLTTLAFYNSWSKKYSDECHTQTTQNLYWKNDSFYLEQEVITLLPYVPNDPPDTIFYRYQGRKK